MEKDFSEFRALINEEYILNISNKINEVKLETKIPTDQESANEFIGAIGATNLMFMLELLKTYHQWYSKEN